jgi:hypothetical protein
MSRLSKPVPTWLLLIAIIATASVVSTAFVIPGLLRSKPDFVLETHPVSSLILTGNEEQFVVSVRSINNFSGIVSLRIVPPASGMNASLFSNAGISPDVIPLGHIQNLTLDLRAFSWGNYTVGLIATSGQLYHSTKVFVIAQSVAISATPDTITLSRGSTASFQIALSSRNGLFGNLSLFTSILHCCAIDPGLQATLSRSMAMLPLIGTVTVIMTIQASSTAQSWNVGFSVCPVSFPTTTLAGASMCVSRIFYVVIS